MENASKALIMAGGVLIGILIITLAVYLFIDFGTTSAEINRENDTRQLTQFNTQFSVYLGRTNISGYELISVINLAKENNRQNANTNNYNYASNGYRIEIYVDGRSVVDENLSTLEEKYLKNNESNQLYTCSNVVYDDENGRIRSVYFVTN